jgi:hypothetical protein
VAFGSVVIAFTSNDAAAAEWLSEFLAPWFRPSPDAAGWHVRMSSSLESYLALRNLRPHEPARRPCFAFDQQVLSLPAWPSGGQLVFDDAERSCCFAVTPSRVDLVGDPRTRRWRYTWMWVFHEITATRLRRTHLDLHAAAVEAGGRALLISGPKRAGKTTVSFHLLRSGRCRSIANDRAFAGAAGASFLVRGMPTAVKILPSTAAEFPEIRRGIPGVERPYLFSLDELARVPEGRPPDSDEFALSPALLLRQLQAQPLDAAPLGAIVFPQIRTDIDGWHLERLDADTLHAAVWANLYGSQLERRTATIFEDFDGGPTPPSGRLAVALSEAVPVYRLLLGRRAYDDRDFAPRLLDILNRP